MIFKSQIFLFVFLFAFFFFLLPAKGITENDLFPSKTLGPLSKINQLEEDSFFLEQLKSEIFPLITYLKRGVNVLLKVFGNPENPPEDILKEPVCGRATRILGFFLREKGFHVQKFETFSLGINYPDQTHAVLAVTNPKTNHRIIVDPAYLQFLSVFDLNQSEFPKEEILVFLEKNLDEIADFMASFRGKKLKNSSDPESFLRKHPVFRYSYPELIQYFRTIWNLENYTLFPHKLEEQVKMYETDPFSIDRFTQRLIEEWVKKLPPFLLRRCSNLLSKSS